MSALIDFVKSTLIPGSLSFLVLTVTAALALMTASSSPVRRVGRWLLVGVIAAYWICSVPAVVDLLQGAPGRPSVEAEQCLARPHCTLVVLGSGMQAFRSGGATISTPMAQTVLNALRARELAARTDGFIIVSGGGPPAPQASSEAALVAGLLGRIRRELADAGDVAARDVHVVLTGGLSQGAWAGTLDGIEAVDPELTLKGLAILHAEVAGGQPLQLNLS